MIKNEQTLQNRYLIEKQIGVGGMGAVYLGVDQRFGSVVAIKKSITSDSARLSRAFEHEAQLLNSLRHPALPHVIDYFFEGDGQFIVMEYIDGEDLSEIIERNGAFAVNDVLRWADDLLDALNYLHTQQFPVVHRDIKPQNLKLTSAGKIILLDFGLAKGNPADLSRLTMTKSIFGYSRIYASLEQIQGTGTDPRSDLYSLAATLYHLLTGHQPVDALTRAKSVLSDESDLLKSINSSNQNVPLAVAEVLHRALSLNPNLRPQTALEMRTALKTAALETANLPVEVPASNEIRSKNAAQQTNKTVLAIGNNFAQKLKTESQQTVQELAGLRSVFKSDFRPSLATTAKIAAAVLLMCGIAYALLNRNWEHLETVESKNISAQNMIEPTIISQEKFAESNVADSAVSTQSIIQTNGDVYEKPEKQPEIEIALDKPISDNTIKDKGLIAQPTSVLKENTKTKSKQAKSVVTPRMLTQQNAESTVIINVQPTRENKRPPVQKLENVNNRKGNGFKGFFNKIGSGAMRLPKAIFKKNN